MWWEEFLLLARIYTPGDLGMSTPERKDYTGTGI